MILTDIPIPVPARHSPISAKWAGDMTRAMNARRLVAGKGIRLLKSPSGTIVESTAVGTAAANRAEAPRPFACRYATSDETGGYNGWEIYLPPGCVNIGSAFSPLNPKARRKDGKTGQSKETEDGWHRLGLLGGSDTANMAASGGIAMDTFTVEIHCKRFAALEGVDGFEDIPKAYLWAEMRSSNLFNSEDAPKDDFTADLGDTFSAAVGRITVKEREATPGTAASSPGDRYERTHHNSASGCVYVSADRASEGFDLLFSFNVAVNGDETQLGVSRVYMTNKAFNAAGVTFVGNRVDELDMDCAAAYVSIYLKIDTAQQSPVGSILVNEGEAQPDPDTPGGSEAQLKEVEFINANRQLSLIHI